MEKVLLIIGNITFHHFTEEELLLFKNPNAEQKALVHEIDTIVECNNRDEAMKLGEDSLGVVNESYLVLGVFNGEIVYECENNNLPITVEDYKKEFIN